MRLSAARGLLVADRDGRADDSIRITLTAPPDAAIQNLLDFRGMMTIHPRGRIVPRKLRASRLDRSRKSRRRPPPPGVPDAPALRPARVSRPRRPPGCESPTSVRRELFSPGAPAWLPAVHTGSPDAPAWLRSARPFPSSQTGLPPRHWVRSAQLHWVRSARRMARNDVYDPRTHAFSQPSMKGGMQSCQMTSRPARRCLVPDGAPRLGAKSDPHPSCQRAEALRPRFIIGPASPDVPKSSVVGTAGCAGAA